VKDVAEKYRSGTGTIALERHYVLIEGDSKCHEPGSAHPPSFVAEGLAEHVGTSG
jgi:hypothetical protein